MARLDVQITSFPIITDNDDGRKRGKEAQSLRVFCMSDLRVNKDSRTKCRVRCTLKYYIESLFVSMTLIINKNNDTNNNNSNNHIKGTIVIEKRSAIVDARTSSEMYA